MAICYCIEPSATRLRLFIEMLLLLLNKLAILLSCLQGSDGSIPVDIFESLTFVYKTVHVIK